MERDKALDMALSQIEKQFGKGSVMRMGENLNMGIESISTGALALDMALGIGGLPRGRIVEIYGPESSGKSTLAMHVVAEAQRNGGICAYIDAEHAMDPVYAGAIGVNVDDLLISQPDTGEQALEIADMLIRSGALDVLVIDSVAALTPRAEIEGEMGDSHVGLQARLMSQALRKLTGTLSKSNTIAVFINQLREKIGVMYGSPEVTPGGRALKFYSSVRLDIRRIEQIKDGAEVVGQPYAGEGRQEQGQLALQAGRVRHHVRPGHQPRGLPARRGCGARSHQEVRGMVHLRGRAARPGPRERQAVPPGDTRADGPDQRAHPLSAGRHGAAGRNHGGRHRGRRSQHVVELTASVSLSRSVARRTFVPGGDRSGSFSSLNPVFNRVGVE